MSEDDFVTMMLVDGCFVVEFLILYYVQYCLNAFSRTQNYLDLFLYQRTHEIYTDLLMLKLYQYITSYYLLWCNVDHCIEAHSNYILCYICIF